MTSSPWGAAQPPWAKPPRGSSSARPGPCITPSSVMWLCTTSLPMPCLLLQTAYGTRRYSTTDWTGLSSTLWTEMATSPPAPRSARKRQAILDAATTTFLSKGYLGTSMDEIAALAQVSKQTVYKHFADKESLFTEIVTGTVNEISDPVHDEVAQLADSGDLEADLRDLARRLLARLMQPRLLELRRLVIAEANRFPELGLAFYERGPGRTMAALASVFER